MTQRDEARFGGRRDTVRHSGRTHDPAGTPEAADRLTALAHEIGNMLDGSMRWLRIATESLPASRADDDAAQLDVAREQLETVQHTLGRMASLVDAAMRSKSMPIGSPLLIDRGAVSLGEAIDHAVDVIRPFAREHGVEVTVDIEREAGLTRAGAMYSVLLNGMRNAIESIARCPNVRGETKRGLVHIAARSDSQSPQTIVLEITDDGHGLPEGGADWAFKHGFTIKADGPGIGLAISKELVEESRGSIELVPNPDRDDIQRPGAILRVIYPEPIEDTEIR